uniref:Uncharacterized protein n=1 Tax=Acrobeloides nanus TaxID=290746 RepID=A0A914CGB5_9BILA
MAAGYFNGPIANIVGGIPQIMILFSLYAQKAVALILALIYRRAQLSLGRLNELFDKPKFLLFFAGLNHIVVNGIMVTPVLFWVPEIMSLTGRSPGPMGLSPGPGPYESGLGPDFDACWTPYKIIRM